VAYELKIETRSPGSKQNMLPTKSPLLLASEFIVPITSLSATVYSLSSGLDSKAIPKPPIE